MTIIQVPTNYYQQFDADHSKGNPAESFGGWRKEILPFNSETTAVVVMHAWDCGTLEEYPGWYQAVEYIPRANEICKQVFPELLKAARASGLKLYHVAAGGDYYKNYPGFQKTAAFSQLASHEHSEINEELTKHWTLNDPTYEKLQTFKFAKSTPGEHNMPDITRGLVHLNFPPEAKPHGEESIVDSSEQLLALCRNDNINHIIYIGFAINWCLLLEPGGMVDMSRYGIICSTIRQAVTAVENKESAAGQWAKELALWRVALRFGYVYDLSDILNAIR